MADTINNTNDDLNRTTDSAHGTEPATSHDVTEGGVLGAVGGAVVGMLAGGPIGAVIGAVAGGIASAGAVGVVDKHDHDYDRTVGTDGTHTSVTGLPTDGSTTAHNTGVISAAPATGYTDTTTMNTGVIGTTTGNAEVIGTAPTAASFGSNLSQNTGTVAASGETVIPVVEEELVVGKREVQSGGAHIRTGVIETPVQESVSLHEEHVTVQRQAVNQPVTDAATAFQEKSFEVTETAEVPVVAKSARVVEEVVVGKTATDRTETVRDTVRRTDVEVDELTAGDVKTGDIKNR